MDDDWGYPYDETETSISGHYGHIPVVAMDSFLLSFWYGEHHHKPSWSGKILVLYPSISKTPLPLYRALLGLWWMAPARSLRTKDHDFSMEEWPWWQVPYWICLLHLRQISVWGADLEVQSRWYSVFPCRFCMKCWAIKREVLDWEYQEKAQVGTGFVGS